jgi:mannose-6-phosphate isomerase
MAHMNTEFFFPMRNVIQNYAWGSPTAIHEMFGVANPDDQPQAEIWMGAHPNGCSKIVDNGEEVLLADFINLDKAGILNASTEIQFGELPYLFKILAADKALSIQVHPSKAQAECGFQLEEEAGISRTAPNRNYKDPNHKPELVYALTAYQAMNGFREFDEIIALFREANIKSITALFEEFASSPDEAHLQVFFRALLSLNEEHKASAIQELITFAEQHKHRKLCALILDLALQYPGDIGLFCPLMLHVLTLQPGEAMFLHACTPHAYIRGVGLEIMANSDNVLRSGLTPKHIDVAELVKCTQFVPKPADTLLITPEYRDGGEFYPVPVDDFKFAIYTAPEATTLLTDSAEILLALDSEMKLSHASGDTVTVTRGESVFIPAFTGQYQVTSAGRVARAFN